MNAPSRDIVDMLEQYGDSSGFDLSLSFGNNLHISREPSKPINCVTIFDVEGYPPELNLTTQGYEYPSIQIRVRNTKYLDAMNLAQKIKDALHGRSHETWNSALYTVIYALGNPALLDYDDNGNARVIINFNLQRHAV